MAKNKYEVMTTLNAHNDATRVMPGTIVEMDEAEASKAPVGTYALIKDKPAVVMPVAEVKPGKK